MKRRLISVAAAIAASSFTSFAAPTYGYRSWYGPTTPVPPTINRERHCARCRVGILTGRLCTACQRAGKR